MKIYNFDLLAYPEVPADAPGPPVPNTYFDPLLGSQNYKEHLYEMDELRPGNEIAGLAVIEAPNTTLFLPAQWKVRIDEHEIYWLTRAGARG